MKILFFGLISFLLSLNLFAQKFTILKTVQPFYSIIEWKGMGAMLLSKDPTNNSKQIYLTLVGESDKSIWEQQFIPANNKYYYISSENARYVYFLRDLKPENGKVYFDQLNSAGNIKNTNVSIISAIKNLGYDPLNLTLKNVVVTDKALVYHFRDFNKSDKIHTDIALFITHHNLLPYAVVLGTTSDEELKAGRVNHFQYVGFTGDEICFADYSVKKEGKGWTIVKFNSKGKELNRVFIKNNISTTSTFSTSGFGTNGAYYLQSENGVQNGLVTFQNNQFYLTTITATSTNATMELHQLNDNKWEKINQLPLSPSKGGYTLGVYPQNEAMTYRVTSKEFGDKTVALFLNGATPTINPFNESVIYNPSRMIVTEKSGLFAISLPTRTLFFDANQFKSTTDMEFEFIQK
ncbi:MAG: hypothetical protein M9916_08630 [Crocinitomicaceae bacterium]|nr:hypothetical protein [Crocinitomicaceae bacterium]